MNKLMKLVFGALIAIGIMAATLAGAMAVIV